MSRPRIVIADSDINYIIPIQLKFIEDFYEKIDLEIITENSYFEEFFSIPQKVDIFVVSEELYDPSVKRNNISHIFLMSESSEEENTADLTITRIYKYTSIKEIFNEISGKSRDVLKVSDDVKKEPEIILVTSGSGGVGKTTVALGMSACLAKNYKNVLYINASRMHTFQRFLDNGSPITSDVYSSFIKCDNSLYNDIKHIIRKESFFYLPPFSTALLSLGLSYSLFYKLAVEAKKSCDYDYIVVDADSTFDETNAELINIASKVIIVTNQSENSVFSTSILISNISGIKSEKYCFVCNDFKKDEDNALISTNNLVDFTVSEYIEHIDDYGKLSYKDFEKIVGIQKTAFLII